MPQVVLNELQESGAPAAVKNWTLHRAAWLEVRPDPPADAALSLLDPGEAAAISLALLVQATRLLIDDWEGRAEAHHRRLLVSGTLGVLAAAHQMHLIDFELALTHLAKTNFYLSPQLVETMRRRLASQGGRP